MDTPITLQNLMQSGFRIAMEGLTVTEHSQHTFVTLHKNDLFVDALGDGTFAANKHMKELGPVFTMEQVHALDIQNPAPAVDTIASDCINCPSDEPLRQTTSPELTPSELEELTERNNRMRVIAKGGVADMVATIAEMCDVANIHDADSQVMVSVIVSEFFSELTIDRDPKMQPIHNAICDAIVDRVFPHYR